ncbi:MAG: hypothetical protein GX996_08335 [Firmicutes bacterium]|nr:hypothetical protein [Bacillota bacterium]
MKKGMKVARGFLYAVALWGVAVILISYFPSVYYKDKGAADIIDVHGNNLENLLTKLEEHRSPYPYGGAVHGVLDWEDDNNFLKACRRCETRLRMAAFQITLLDILPEEKYNMVLAADLLSGIVVEPGEHFSFNGAIGPYSKERGFKEGPIYSGNSVMMAAGGGVCKVATTLYNVAVLANLDILERHPHSMLVPYVFPGQDATVAYGSLDFSFKNGTDYPLLIWTGTKANTLTVAIYGRSHPPKVAWHHELLSWQKKHTVYRHNPNLSPGEERVVVPGAGSVTVKVWLTIENIDGSSFTKDLGIIYYNPMPKIIEKVFEG